MFKSREITIFKYSIHNTNSTMLQELYQTLHRMNEK
jgi:hypothetical protein